MSQPTVQESSVASRRVDGLGWALAFIWVGVAMFAEVGWGWLLAGLGLIALGGQAALAALHEKTSGFWIACGLVLLGSGVWTLLRLQWPLAPALFIIIGVAILFSALAGKKRP